MPIYNGEAYLEEAMRSILSQTFTRFEFILVDDGSTDASATIVHAFGDPRIRYIYQENQGIAGALRTGCTLAQGKYIARMDADDISLPERFSHQVAYLEQHPETILVSSAVLFINAEGKVTGRSFPYTSDRAIRKKLERFNPVCHPAVMMRREAYLRSGGYLDIQPFEDHLLWISLSSLGMLHNLPVPMLKYRILPSSLSRSLPATEQARLFRILLRSFRGGGLHDGEVAAFRQAYRDAVRNPPHTEQAKARPHGSALQATIAGWLNCCSVPSSFTEKLICTVKNVLA